MSDDSSAAVVDTSAVDSVIVNSTAPVESTSRDIAVTVTETTTTVTETVTEAVKPSNPFFAFLISLAFCKCAAPSQTAEVTDKSITIEAVASPAPTTAAAAITETESTSTIVVAEATASFEEFVEVTTTTVTTTETIVEEVDSPVAENSPASPISEVASSTLTDDTTVKKSEDNNTGSEAGSTSGTKEKKARRRMSQTIKEGFGKIRTLGRSKTSASLEETKEEKEA
ncbi:hypothetical protein BJ742DRAFT_36638 [Cladochytrium replicatum]|nr:hypothetical protein BJ742DRAFT_36638 [Cladochytrium replicatum]